ncbi:MAG: M48 family metallopeptidase [Pseudomonadota bacterium]
MRSVIKSALAVAALTSGLSGCVYNEELGRSQFMLTGNRAMASAATASWNQIKQQQPISRDPRYTARLNRVAQRILRAAGEDPNRWEYLVFEDDSLNAFALPGERIGIHTGIMDIMENDAQLATVVGHEIAHVKYQHSGERYSQQLAASLGIGIASIAASASCDSPSARDRQNCQQRNSAAVQAIGLGAMFGAILPYSRKHELEADVGGVRYMAQAGYDVCESLKFWTKMAQASSGQGRPPEFASTHPAAGTRISQLRNTTRQLGKNCR